MFTLWRFALPVTTLKLFKFPCPSNPAHSQQVLNSCQFEVLTLQLTVIHNPLVLADADLVLIQTGCNILVLLIEQRMAITRLPPTDRHFCELPWWVRNACGDVDRCDDAGTGVGDYGNSGRLIGRRFRRLGGGSHSVGVAQLYACRRLGKAPKSTIYDDMRSPG